VIEDLHDDTGSGTATALRGAGSLAGMPTTRAALGFARSRHAGQRRELGIRQVAMVGKPKLGQTSATMPLMTSQRPITTAPITAAVRPRRAIQALTRSTLAFVLSGANT
jgi:hypothetical protein